MSVETRNIKGYEHVRYERDTYSAEEATTRSREFYNWLDTRRTVREISDKPVPKPLIENLVMAASSAPSGAHKQPWTFCLVSNPKIKNEIRREAEKEEFESYSGRMSDRWKKDLEPLGTDWNKPFLEKAPWLVIVFKRVFELDENGIKNNNYYVNESVGIACGFFLTALHKAGLVTLTHTPSPMNFLTKILNRPDNERPYLLLPIGYPEDEVYVPNIKRKPLEEVTAYYE
ncbi:MAG: nitroreductase family protein [Cyclobacteriaceae bacterium]